MISAIYAIKRGISLRIADTIASQVEAAKVWFVWLKKCRAVTIVRVELVVIGIERGIGIEIEIEEMIEEMIEIVGTADVTADLVLAQAVIIKKNVKIRVTIDVEKLAGLPRKENIIEDIDKHIILWSYNGTTQTF